MMKSELIERLNGLGVKLPDNTIDDADYAALENWYIALDLDKDVFAGIVTVVGMEKLVARNTHAITMITAMDEYKRREQYKRDKIKLEELAREVYRLEESTKAFEKAQIF